MPGKLTASQRYYLKQKKAGRCTRDGMPLDKASKHYCTRHKEMHRLYERARRLRVREGK